MKIEEVLHSEESNQFRYSKVKESASITLYNEEGEYDISFIVPVRGRTEFLPTLYDAFQNAAAKTDKRICFTVAEHDVESKHKEFCEDNEINHIFIPYKADGLFNKCLLMNCATMWGHQAEYWLFHDLDCIMQSDFFPNIFANLERKEGKVAQTFVDRRVLYCDEGLTQEILEGGFDYDVLKLDRVRVTLPQFVGAPGGSLIIHRDIFEKVGMYDHLLFQANSPEDAFMWKKLELFGEVVLTEFPANDLFHLNHPITYHSNPKEREMKALYNQFIHKTKFDRESTVQLICQKVEHWKS